jgi:thiosulfate reductase cytochrome b subunit
LGWQLLRQFCKEANLTEVLTTPKQVIQPRWIKRHSGIVRLTHWINVLCLTVLLMSGLQIFNAHPALYWGQRSDFEHPWLAINASQASDAGEIGMTTIAGRTFNTTGVLGVSKDGDGEPVDRAFPRWSTIPSDQDLATGRRWHFFFAWLFVLNGVVYLVSSLLSQHVSRDLIPSLSELAQIPHAIVEHAQLRFPKGEAARHYNVVQKLTYLIVIFALLPIVVLAGMTMSPGLDTAVPQLLWLFGGRQSARSIHFIAATGILLFVIIHIVMVLVSGVFNNIRSMVTGRYDLGVERES